VSAAYLIFPHQLYTPGPPTDKHTEAYLIEEHLYFHQYPFHQAKLVYHRASMKAYGEQLQKAGHKLHYLEATSALADVRNLLPWLAQNGIQEIIFFDPTDDWLLRRITTVATQQGIQYKVLPSPNFICAPDELIAGRKQPTYFQTDFYIRQRKKNRWLIEKDGKPVGGQWTFDADNRKSLPKGLTIPSPPPPVNNPFTQEAIAYVRAHFSKNYGDGSICRFPIDRASALAWLDDFFTQRFQSFGDYEDAMHPDEILLFHSGITPMLNVGLLNPNEVIERALAFAERQNIPLSSLEGFIRQVSGWREFIRLVYVQVGRTQRTTNYWQFNRKIPDSFWTGDTGIEPVDRVIKKLLKTGYSHHIERLMVLGNFMLLCEFDPDEVYRWFMTLYIDAYDWVMVPNVYGMTQFADGGLMTTKPYISGSNYLMKMGKWEKGEWQGIWDGLFWRFMHKHRTFFLQNPRLGMLIKTWDKMDSAKQQLHLQRAENFLQSLDA
jgi:deoxyribodipyrimidine photolyase-related protein